MPKPQSNVINLHFYALAKPEFDKTIRIVNELQKTEKGEHNYEVRGQIRDALATAMGYAYVAQKHGDYLIMSDEDRQALLNEAAQETEKLKNSGALDDLTRYMPLEQLGVLLNPPQEWSPKGYCEWFEKNLQEHLRGGYVREQMDRTIKNTLDLGLSRGEDGSPGWDPFDDNHPWGEEKDRVITGFARARVLMDILNTKADFTQDSKPMSGAEIFHDIDRRETELRNTPGFQAVMEQTGPADMVELLAKRKEVMGEPLVEARTLGNFDEVYDRRVRFYLAKAERVAEEKAAAEAKRKEEEAKQKAEAEKKAAEEAKQKAEAEQRAAEEKKWKDDVRQRAAEEAKLAEDAFTRGEISVETAKYHVATLIALERMGAAGKKGPEATVQSELDAWRKKVMDGRAFQRVTEDKSGAEIAAICGKFDAEGKTFKAYAGAELEDSFTKAVATRIQNRAMLHIRERITKGQFDVKDAKNIRSNLSYAFVAEDILNGTFKPGKAPLDSGDWKIVTDKADSLWKQSSFKQLRNKSREDLAKLCGTYDPETHEFKLLPKDEIFKNVNAERERYSEQKKQEKAAAEKKAAEEKAAAEKKAAEEQAAREAEEKKAEAERRAAREAHLKEQKRKFGISASGKEPNLTAFGYFLDGVDRSLTITLPDLDSGRPLSARTMENIGMTFTDWMSNIQIASDPEYADLQDQPHYRKVVDWRNNTEGYKFRDTPAYKELFRPGRETDVLRIVCGHPDQWKDGKPEVLPYDEVKKNFDEKVRQIEAELKDPEAKKRGEEEKAKLDAAEAPERAKREQARQEAIKEAARLEAEKRRLEREAEEREKKAAREELLRKRDEEAQEDALSDEEISGLDVQQVGKRLGDEIRKIETFLNGQHMDLISEWLWNAIDYFKDAKGNEDLKAGIQEAEGAFNREIRSEKKTLGDFAREEHVLGPNFDRLMKRAVELASMERQVDEKAEEARLKEEQEKKAAEEARLKEEQEKAAVKADSPKDEEEWAKEDEEYAKKKAKEEQEKEEARREKMRRDRAEEERMNPVDDKILAKLNVEQVASLLCNDLEYLADAMDGSFGKGAEIYVLYDPLDRMREVESSEDLKAAIEAMEQTINSTMLQSEGKTIAKFAKDENLLGANHEKVLKRAKELAGMDLQTEQKIEEQKIEEQRKEEPKIEEVPKEEPKVEEAPKEEPKVEEVPKEEPKVEEAPKEEPKIEEVPKEEPKVEEVPKEEPKVEEVPKEEPKVEEAPKEEVKVEEAPKEEAKVEEAPKVEEKIEEVKVEEVPKPAEKIEEKPEQVEDQREVIEGEKRSAAKWIEAFKREFRDDPQMVREQDDYPAAHIARIMAARQLSNSTRGKLATLNVQMTQADIEKQARLIMGKDSFKKFAEELKQPDKLRKVEAVFTKRFSHGGELDDSFRSYLTNRPAGELENDPDLKRWMPTIKQRVEKLQKDAAKAIKKQETPYVAAAEIVALRQMAEVQRGGRGLEANIPVVGEKDGNVKDLSKASRKFAKSQLFKDAFDKQEVKKYILSGHGGAMVENYEKATKEVKEEAPVKHTGVKLNK